MWEQRATYSEACLEADKWSASFSVILLPLGSAKYSNFLASCATVSFSTMTLLHVLSLLVFAPNRHFCFILGTVSLD